MSNRHRYLDTGKGYAGKHQRSGHRESGHSDKYYRGWGAGKDKPQSTFEKSGADPDPHTSQKRKAYGRDHSDTLAKRPRFNENYHQKNYDRHSTSQLQKNNNFKIQNKTDTVEFVPKKSSAIPSPYAHLPPSPPRYAKPVDNSARLLKPPAGITINITPNNNWTVVSTKSQPANNCNSGNINRFDNDNEGYKTNTANFPQTSDKASAESQSGDNNNPSTLHRFKDIKDNHANTEKLSKCSNSTPNYSSTKTGNFPQLSDNSTNSQSGTGYGNIKGYKTSTRNLRKPPNITPGDSTYCDKKINTNTGNIPEVVKSSTKDPMIVAEQSSTNDDNNRNMGSIKPYTRDIVSKSENTDNYTGNKSTYVQHFGPLNNKPQIENNNMNLSNSNGKPENFQLFPIAINPQTSNMDSVISKGSANNRTRPSRFDKPLPENNISRSQFGDNNGQLKNAPRFDNIKNAVKNNNPTRFNDPPTVTQLADNIWPLHNAPQIDNIGNTSKCNTNRFNVPPPGMHGPFGTTGHPSKIDNNNRFNVPPPVTHFGDNSGGLLNKAPRFGQNMNTNRFNVPPPGTQFGNINGPLNNVQQLDNMGGKSGNNNIASRFGDFNGPMENTTRFGRFGKNNKNTSSGKMESMENTGTNNTSGVGNKRFSRNTGSIQQFANTPGTGTRFNRNPGNNDTFNQTFNNNGIHVGPANNNRFNRNTGNFQRYTNHSGNTSTHNTPQFENMAMSRSDNSPANLEQYINNVGQCQPTNIDNNRSQFDNNENSNATNNYAPDNSNVQQFENNGPSQGSQISRSGDNNSSGNMAQFSDNRVRQYEDAPGHNETDNGKNLQFGMKRRHAIKSDFRFINKMDQHFGNNNNNSNFSRQQLPMMDDDFQINPPLFREMGGGNERFYEDINPAPPVEDTNYKNFEKQNNCPGQTTRFGVNNNGRGNTRRFGNNSRPGQMRQFGNNNGRQFGNNNGPPSRNQQFGNKFSTDANRQFVRNQQMTRGRGNFNQRRNYNAPNRSQTGYNKIPRFGTNQGRFASKSAIANGNSTGVQRPSLRRPFGDMKNRFGKPQNKFGKLLKKASNKLAKGPKNPNKEKKTFQKLKKPKKTKDGDQKPEDEHIDVNKQIFGDFQPIAVGQKKPAKGHLKPEPETYWKQWWSLYGYVEKCLTHIDPTDESVKSVIHFNHTPTDSEYRQRKRTLLVMGVAKILRHIRLNESDYALRDIFNVLKYKHQLEDPKFQQHLTPKEMERVEKVLKHARKKTRRALFYQSLICRWHFSTVIMKRAENGESLKCGHARKLISDKAFNYLVWESIQELKKLTLEDWPEFDEFYRTL